MTNATLVISAEEIKSGQAMEELKYLPSQVHVKNAEVKLYYNGFYVAACRLDGWVNLTDLVRDLKARGWI